MHIALEENGTNGLGKELGAGGITIDLSHKNIHGVLPEEIVDIIKRELERLALSNNKITTLPTRFAECQSLRYINVRDNKIREFPMVLCELTRLEILDISRNKIRILPPELAKLKSLKVLSAQKNRIEELPLSLADMASLQCIKLEGNPVRFPPKELLLLQAGSPPNGIELKENDQTDVAVTAQIKRFLKQRLIMERSEAESGGEESSEGGHTPRPLKRVTSGRFPIKVNGSDVPDLRSPALPRAPPIPSRSHYRGLSQQNAALRRPGIMPLTMANGNERMRSNSESLLQRDNKIDRSRRMGIVPKKPSDLGTVDEAKANTNRYSHLRGLSHGSALSGHTATANGNARLMNSAEAGNGRGTYVRRLSSLPEKKSECSSPDPIVECAKGVLFAIEIVNPIIELLMGCFTPDNTSTSKRSSLEMMFSSVAPHVQELDRVLQEWETYSEEDEEIAPRSNQKILSATDTCVTAYIQVCRALSKPETIDSLLKNGDPKYVRVLLLNVYASMAEVYNASAALSTTAQAQDSQTLPAVSEDLDSTMNTLRPMRDRSMTPNKERPGLVIPPTAVPRMRSHTVVQHPSNLRVMTDARTVKGPNGRSATMTSATPRSGESFTSASSSGMPTAEFTAEDQAFHKIVAGLGQSAEMAVRTLPSANEHFMQAMQQGANDQLRQSWQVLIQKCTIALGMAKDLKGRLLSIQLNDRGVRTSAAFWELCNAFMSSYYNLVIKVKEVKAMSPLLSNDIVHRLRPLQKVLKDTGAKIQESPWSHLLSQGPGTQQSMQPMQPLHNGGTYSATHSANPSYAVLSPPPQMPLPMTPASAALGPAVQATVPSTPASANYNTMVFHGPHGNVFERADQLLASESSSAFSSALSSRAGSRAGTMTNNSSFGGGVGSAQTTMTRSRDEYREAAAREGTFSPNNGNSNGFPPQGGSRFGGKVVF